jgi:hypothetical protein
MVSPTAIFALPILVTQKKFLTVTLLLFGLLSPYSTLFSQTVYVTKTGKKYHSDNCRYLSQSKIRTTVDEALSKNYSPCSVCAPPSSSQDKSTTTQTAPIKSATSSQCTAQTKAGKRCSRQTKEANGRCWQHQ